MSRVTLSLDALTKIYQPALLADSNITLTVDNAHRQMVQTPTADRDITLPTANILVGDRVTLYNLASAFKMIVKASGGAVLMGFQDGHVVLMAKQDAPTLPAHWAIIEGSGGASPSFRVWRNGNQNIGTSSAEKAQFNSIDLDLNDQFDAVTNYRYTIKVPGIWLFYTNIELINTLAENFTCTLKRSGSAIELTRTKLATTGSIGTTFDFMTILEADVDDYFDITIQSATDTAYVVIGGTLGKMQFGGNLQLYH